MKAYQLLLNLSGAYFPASLKYKILCGILWVGLLYESPKEDAGQAWSLVDTFKGINLTGNYMFNVNNRNTGTTVKYVQS